MSLQLYLSNRWIRRHSSSCDEIERLLAIAKRDIQQSQTPGFGPEWRFDIAYNAALQLATAALSASSDPGLLLLAAEQLELVGVDQVGPA
jgi:hypothetical protein